MNTSPADEDREALKVDVQFGWLIVL